MSKQIGNPRVFWIRLEMASCQKADAAQAQALSILHDAYMAKGVVKAEMITDRDLIKLAAQSVIDGLQFIEEEADASTAEVRSASPADDGNQQKTCRSCKYSHPLFSPITGILVADCKLDKTARNADHPACEKFEMKKEC